MNILITPDKFKKSITADEVAATISSQLSFVEPKWKIKELPMADGGEGSLNLLESLGNFSRIQVKSVDPLGRIINSWFLMQGQTAYIQMSNSSGLELLKYYEYNPIQTSTYGTGLEISQAIDLGAQEINLFVGGSATNDCGIGIAAALGFDFLDRKGNSLEPIGGNLYRIDAIRKHDYKNGLDVQINIYTDVDNPLLGKTGAACSYAPQKGANEQEVDLLEKGAMHLFDKYKTLFQFYEVSKPGLGAAGGVGLSLVALFGAQIKSGSEFFVERFNLNYWIDSWADIVITGEGALDNTSLQNKVVGKIIELCELHAKPVVIICGQVKTKDLANREDIEVFSLVDFADSVEQSIENPSPLIRKSVMKWLNSMRILK